MASVFVLSPRIDALQLARDAAEAGWRPRLLLPGPFAPLHLASLPAAFADRTWVAHASVAADQQPGAVRRYRDVLARSGAPPLPGYQLPVYAATLAVAEALRAAGPQPSAESLVGQLAALRDFATGLVPPLSFGSGRVGAAGGHVLAPTADGALHSVTGFVRLPPD